MGPEVMTIVDIIIALCYFLLSFIIVALPFAVKPLRVLRIWGAIMAFHFVLFLTGCGLHHLEWSTHAQVSTSNPVTEETHHFLVPALMQIYGALGVGAVLVFRGKRMTNNLVREIVRTEHEKDVLATRDNER